MCDYVTMKRNSNEMFMFARKCFVTNSSNILHYCNYISILLSFFDRIYLFPVLISDIIPVFSCIKWRRNFILPREWRLLKSVASFRLVTFYKYQAVTFLWAIIYIVLHIITICVTPLFPLNKFHNSLISPRPKWSVKIWFLICIDS